MKLDIRYQILFILISLNSCKKSDQSKSSVINPLPAKSIEVINGNNQLGYAGKILPDTILIRVVLNSLTDTSKFGYYYKTSSSSDQFSIIGHTYSNGMIYLKAVWTLSTTTTVPLVTFYTYSGCSITSNKSNCKSLDSIKITAIVRKPWVSVYYGSQSGLDVLYDLHFTDNNNGIAIGEGSGVVRTSNEGKTWTQGPAIRSDDDMQQLSFSDADTGLMIVTNNYGYFTYDGGSTYIQENWLPPFVGDRSSAAYYMESRNIIYTVGSHGQIAKTVDGGTSWALFTGFTFLNNFNDIVATGKDTLYACGDVGKVVKTVNAGKTWYEQPLQLNNNLNKLYFVTNKYGFSGGQYGALIRTTDGGATWSNIKTGLRFSIIAIRFFDAKHGFIVSSGGEIAESKDGGSNWIMRNTDNYGVGDLNKAVIKDDTIIFGLQESSIYTYDLTQQ